MTRPRRPSDEVIARAGILTIVVALAIGLTVAGRDARDARESAAGNGRQLAGVTAQLAAAAEDNAELRQLAQRQADLLADLAAGADLTTRQKSALADLADLAARLTAPTSSSTTTTTPAAPAPAATAATSTRPAAPTVTVIAPSGPPGPTGPPGPPGPVATPTPCALDVLGICLRR